jgi:hypothetical protein
MVADPPPCDPSNPRRALAYCEKARHGQRCSCQFELAAIAEDLEDLGLGESTTEFESELDADSLADLTEDLLNQILGWQGGSAVRLREELVLLQELARQGSGVKPVNEE